MAKILENEVDIQAPLETVSIAMNGLLNLDDDLRRVRNVYSFDIRKDKMLRRSPDRLYLQKLYSMIKRGEFRLEEFSEESTRLYYSLEYKRYGGAFGVIFMAEFLIFMVCGIIVSMLEPSIAMLFFGVTFAVFALMVLIFGIVIFFTYSSKAVEKRFHRDFLPRLDSYIEIVKKKVKKPSEESF